MKINIIRLLISVLGCQAAGLIGGLFTRSSVETWYKTIQKPAFTPPNWIFGPVWILLYLLMGISLYLIWNSNIQSNYRNPAIILFLIQLTLNILWSFLFFYLKNPFAGFIEILILLIFIILTAWKFLGINKIASFLMIPYILWVGFAAILTFSIWTLNR